MTFDQKPDGGPGSSREMLPEVYDERRKLARARMGRERGEQTLQPTALVRETYLRVAGADPGLTDLVAEALTRLEQTDAPKANFLVCSASQTCHHGRFL